MLVSAINYERQELTIVSASYPVRASRGENVNRTSKALSRHLGGNEGRLTTVISVSVEHHQHRMRVDSDGKGSYHS